jgi:AcrR family transcriptional regulator
MDTQEAIRRAAIKLIARHGYEATTLRMLAHEVGIKAPSLYNHVSNKQDLLADILKTSLLSCAQFIRERLPEDGTAPEQLIAFVQRYIEYSCRNADEVFVANSELRSLTAKNRKLVIEIRNDFEQMLVTILERGSKSGDFAPGNVKLVTFALFAVLIGVTNWYKPRGGMSSTALQMAHADIALRMVAARPDVASRYLVENSAAA